MLKQLIKYDWQFVLLLLLIIELIINPIGEFPLNDDWAYAKTIASYLNSGTINFSFWQAIPDLPQLFLGIVSCKLFGFSFTLLRLLSVFFLGITIYVLSGILKELEVRPNLRLIVLMIFTFNPITVSLANSFLPDILQLLLSLLAFRFILTFLKERTLTTLFLFTLFSLLATLNRQTGIVIPFIFGIIYFITTKKTIRNCIVSLAPVLICFLGLAAFELIARSNHKLPGNYNLQLNNIVQAATHPSINYIKSFVYYFITSSLCLGLFILPLTICNIKEHVCRVKKQRLLKFILLAYLALINLKIIFSGNIFPFVGNMLYHLGTGPVILNGFNTDDPEELSGVSKIIWGLLNIIGGLSFFMSILSIGGKLKGESPAKFCAHFFILLLALYLLPICVNYANDRYLVYLLPFYFIAYMLAVNFNFNKIFFLMVFVPMFYFTVASSHDYLSINRARWRATYHLTKELNILPNNIDGGFEFNGWHLAGSKNYIPSHKSRWWWVQNDEYVVSPVNIAGYTIESEYYFSSWLSFKFDRIYALKKVNQVTD